MNYYIIKESEIFEIPCKSCKHLISRDDGGDKFCERGEDCYSINQYRGQQSLLSRAIKVSSANRIEVIIHSEMGDRRMYLEDYLLASTPEKEQGNETTN